MPAVNSPTVARLSFSRSCSSRCLDRRQIREEANRAVQLGAPSKSGDTVTPRCVTPRSSWHLDRSAVYCGATCARHSSIMRAIGPTSVCAIVAEWPTTRPARACGGRPGSGCGSLASRSTTSRPAVQARDDFLAQPLRRVGPGGGRTLLRLQLGDRLVQCGRQHRHLFGLANATTCGPRRGHQAHHRVHEHRHQQRNDDGQLQRAARKGCLDRLVSITRHERDSPVDLVDVLTNRRLFGDLDRRRPPQPRAMTDAAPIEGVLLSVIRIDDVEVPTVMTKRFPRLHRSSPPRLRSIADARRVGPEAPISEAPSSPSPVGLVAEDGIIVGVISVENGSRPGRRWRCAPGRRDVDDERNLQHRRKQVVGVAPLAVFPEHLAVIRGQDHDTAIVQTALLEEINKAAESSSSMRRTRAAYRSSNPGYESPSGTLRFPERGHMEVQDRVCTKRGWDAWPSLSVCSISSSVRQKS